MPTEKHDHTLCALADQLMESQHRHSRRSLDILEESNEDRIYPPESEREAHKKCFAPIAVFLEHDGSIEIKQATATLLRLSVRKKKGQPKNDVEKKMPGKGTDDLPEAKDLPKSMLKIAIFPASSIKVPVPEREATFYKVRAVVLFAEDGRGGLDTSWLLGRLPTVEGLGPDKYLVEGVHYRVCPGSNSAKFERKHNDFAVISLISRTILRCPEPATINDKLHCESIEGEADYQAFADKMSTVSEYHVAGYTMVKIDDGKVWEDHLIDLVNGSHQLYERKCLVVSVKARHAWEGGNDVNRWRMPKKDRQYEKPPKRTFPALRVLWHNFRVVFKKDQRKNFRWTTLPVLMRTPIPVDRDLLLAQGLDATGAPLGADIVESLKSGGMTGGPWCFVETNGMPQLIGMHLGGPSVVDPNSSEGIGGLCVALAFQHRVVDVLSLLLKEMSTEVRKVEALAKERPTLAARTEAKKERADEKRGNVAVLPFSTS